GNSDRFGGLRPGAGGGRADRRPGRAPHPAPRPPPVAFRETDLGAGPCSVRVRATAGRQVRRPPGFLRSPRRRPAKAKRPRKVAPRMNASFVRDETWGENLQAELTDAAFRVAARYGVKGPSVDQEVDLWKALGRVVGKQRNTLGGRAVPADDRRGRETLVAEA